MQINNKNSYNPNFNAILANDTITKSVLKRYVEKFPFDTFKTMKQIELIPSVDVIGLGYITIKNKIVYFAKNTNTGAISELPNPETLEFDIKSITEKPADKILIKLFGEDSFNKIKDKKLDIYINEYIQNAKLKADQKKHQKALKEYEYKVLYQEDITGIEKTLDKLINRIHKKQVKYLNSVIDSM